MPLVVDGVQGPVVWAAGPNSRCGSPSGESVQVALINNMPDLALEDTEQQFCDLLHAASGPLPVRLKLFSLPGISRGTRAQQRLRDSYASLNELWPARCDAVIVTGTEPRQPDLRQEPYWPALSELLDWCEQNTASTILSCLAAHAGVLESDGIRRQALGKKQFGVFPFNHSREHLLTDRIQGQWHFPHSRWNEVPAHALTACGYQILTESVEAGVDLFVKRKRKSLFVHCQGHPEYDRLSLLKEYRRDIRRFLKGERDAYPELPWGYFDPAAAELLRHFRARAMAAPTVETMEHFPDAAIAQSLENTWRSPAISLYSNWLEYIMTRKAESVFFPAGARAVRARSVAVGNEGA